MNELQIFRNEEFGSVRTTQINNEPFFVGKDVAAALGYADTSDAIQRHVDEEDKLTRCFTDSGQKRQMYVINESGVYSLILKSKLGTAKQFKRWVTSEVLPSLRKHGMYAADELLDNPDLLIRVASALKAEKEKSRQLEIEKSALTVDNLVMKPKADYFDELVDRNLLTNLRDTAKELCIKEKDFIGYLLTNKYLYRDNKGKLLPYSAKNNGLFELKEAINTKTAWTGNQTLVTPRGRETFRLLFAGI